jgi:protein-S-isoprenylcysteine O-methyltransferase Ste14
MSGMFRIVRHPRYLGDELWGIGWAALTHQPLAVLVPAFEALGFPPP